MQHFSIQNCKLFTLALMLFFVCDSKGQSGSNIVARSCAATYDTLAHAICQGDTFRIGNSIHTQAGNYADTITNVGGCDSVVSLTLTIDTVPVANAGPDMYTCSFASGVYIGTTFFPDNKYLWTPSTGLNNDTSANPNAAISNTTGHPISYTYILTVSNHGCSSSDTTVVTFGNMPNVALSWDSMIAAGSFFASQGDTSVCENQLPVQLTGGAPPGGYWDGAGVLNGILSRTDSTHTGDIMGMEYTISDSNGCDNYAVDIYYLEICSGINEIASDNTLSLYPNPTKGQLLINTQNIQPISITIYDVNGRIIYTMPFKPAIDISELSSGVYFIEVAGIEDMGTGGRWRQPFVKM